VISRSPTEIDPVLAAVVQNASRLCSAAHVSLFRVEGAVMRKVAEQGPQLTSLGVGDTRPISRRSVSGRAIVDRTTIHVSDHQSEQAAREYPEARRDTGIRTTIGIPLLREGVAIGAFTAYRTESRPFSPREIALLQTFADQAVIAIENVRLFKELETRNRALTESLDQQTATSDILQVISQSPTDVQPVFDTIVTNAVRLCGARMGAVYRYDGDLVHLIARHNYPPEALDILQRRFPRPPHPDNVPGRVIITRAVAQIEDLLDDPLIPREIAVAGGWRSILAVPMLREGTPIGAIVITRSEVGRFADNHVQLLKTFGDQAVIAIENVRLFKEL